MSATISQRPAAFCPVNNPVVYKFTVTGGPFTLYRLVIGVYKSSDDTLIGSMSKSPDLAGNILADISSILKAILYRDWDIAVTDEDEIGSIGFYIKYQEFYTGSSTSETDDVAEPRVTVLASLQIGSNADMDEYAEATGSDEKKFLTKFDIMSMWRGYPFSLSSINTTPNYYARIREYNAANTLLLEYGITISDQKLIRIFLNEPDEDAKTLLFNIMSGAVLVLDSSTWTEPSPFSGGSNFGSKTGNVFIKNAMTPVTEYSAEQAAAVPMGTKPAILQTTVVRTVAAGDTLYVQWIFLDAAHGNTGAFIQRSYTTSGTDTDPLDFPVCSVAAAAYLAVISFVIGSAGVANVSIELPAGQAINFSTATARSETKTILVKDPCDNPIYLFWKNTLGGDSFWLFDHNQDYSLDTDDQRKVKQLLLSAQNISVNEFNSINEVNTIGQIYKPVIEELTTDVNKTSQRTDQQLYVIDEDGGKIGVINITQRNATRTKQIKHSIDVTIEYPEIFL